MIKLAFVINYIVKNGPSSVVINIINNIDRNKFKITLITLFTGNDDKVVNALREQGVSVHECSSLRRIDCILGFDKEFQEIIVNERFDVIHTHGLIPDILASRIKCPVKKIATLHNNMFEDYLDTYGFIKSRIFVYLHLKALKRLDKCICCSKSVYIVMKKYLKNVTYIRNGIEAKKAISLIDRKDIAIPNDARIFLYVGVLNTRKKIKWLIKNFVKYHDSKEYLIVLGKGEKESACKKLADDHVKMLGFQSDPIAYMNISDIYVSASKSEGFSISVLEALSCGLGLLLSDIPSHREVIEMGQDVYLGETFSTSNFKDKLNVLRKKEIDKRKNLKFQSKELSAKVMAKKYMECYKR